MSVLLPPLVIFHTERIQSTDDSLKQLSLVKQKKPLLTFCHTCFDVFLKTFCEMKRDDFTAVSPVKQTSLDNSDFFFTLTNVVYFLL